MGAVGVGAVYGRLDGDPAHQGRQLRVGGNFLPEQVINQHGVRELQEAGQGLALLGGGPGQLPTDKALQQDVQFLHTTAAPPQEATGLLVEDRGESRVGVGGHSMSGARPAFS
jgi:hypothetical protein